jgi:membrane protein
MNRTPDPYGRDATRPYTIPLKGWWQIAQRVASKSGSDNLSVISAGCAFYALFAVFPALTACISLFGLTTDAASVDQQFGILADVLPPQGYEIVIDQIRRIAGTPSQTLGGSLIVGLVIALWSANLGTQAMFSALNIAYGEPERRNLFRFYLSAIGYTVIGILGGVAMLFAVVYVPILFADAGHPEAYERIVKIGRWPALALLTLFLLALIYRYGPSRRRAQWEWVTVGSVFATLLWLLASVGFSYYVSNFANYDRMYGSLGAVIILLFWFYLSFYIVLLGAEINAELELQTACDTTQGEPKPMGKRGAFVADHVAGGPKGDEPLLSPVDRGSAAAKPGGE